MNGSNLIGIMADSHGNPDMIAAALRLLQLHGCRHIVHLGDICDSVAYKRSDGCVRLLREHGVKAVKGNNDHAVWRSRSGRQGGTVAPETRDYLAALPLQIEMAGALFVHSRPFADILGMAAMTGDIDQAVATRFLEQYPGRVLFRGHGHSPLVARLTGTANHTVSPNPGERLRLDPRSGWIVTCGALFKGLCMTWDPAAGTIVSHQLEQ
jgi:predicted phosphodiesterase